MSDSWPSAPTPELRLLLRLLGLKERRDDRWTVQYAEQLLHDLFVVWSARLQVLSKDRLGLPECVSNRLIGVRHPRYLKAPALNAGKADWFDYPLR
jgi:hypothetical protein